MKKVALGACALVLCLAGAWCFHSESPAAPITPPATPFRVSLQSPTGTRPLSPKFTLPEVPLTHELVQREALAMNRVDPNPSATAAHYDALAASLTPETRAGLLRWAREGETSNERYFAVYLLALNGAPSARTLGELAILAEPALAEEAAEHQDYAQQSALALRLKAIEALEAAGAHDSAARSELARVAAKAAHPLLRRIASRSLAGLARGERYLGSQLPLPRSAR